VGIIFGGNSSSEGGPPVQVPPDLVTVHVRWGDKHVEMSPPSIAEYVQAVDQLTSNSSTASIYLATEDPRALEEFTSFCGTERPGWRIYHDVVLEDFVGMRPADVSKIDSGTLTKATRGRAGLVALGSLLVALEARYFVLTGLSNWSTLMNQLRARIVDPRCGNCTEVVDLRPGAIFR
jgi:hypothetical protein